MSCFGPILADEACKTFWLLPHRQPGVSKIADFGISKQAQHGAQLHTADVGTLGYMAPEMQSRQGTNMALTSYSFAVDIWAIGVIALELLLGRHPFPTATSLSTTYKGLDFKSSTCPCPTIARIVFADCYRRVRKAAQQRGEARLHAWIYRNNSCR